MGRLHHSGCWYLPSNGPSVYGVDARWRRPPAGCQGDGDAHRPPRRFEQAKERLPERGMDVRRARRLLHSPEDVRAPARGLVKAAGVRPIPLHGARHTSATLSLEAGERADVVAERLGHASAGTTLRRVARPSIWRRIGTPRLGSARSSTAEGGKRVATGRWGKWADHVRFVDPMRGDFGGSQSVTCSHSGPRMRPEASKGPGPRSGSTRGDGTSWSRRLG
jgi:hypothetical protein